MPYGVAEAAACTWTAEACVAAEAIAGLARTGPANPSARMAEMKTDRTVHMIPPRPFPRPAARGRVPASLPGVSTSCRVGSRLGITLCAVVDHYLAFFNGEIGAANVSVFLP